MTSERHGSEMSVFEDVETGRTIWRLTNSEWEDKHTYYDICPWSADQKYIVFSSGDPKYLTIPVGDNLATCGGEVYIMDTENDYAISKVASDGFFTTHSGTNAKWHPTEKKIYYYKAPNRVVAVNVPSGERERVIEGGIRQLSPDGEKFSFSSNRADYAEGKGIYTMDEDGSNRRRIVTSEEIYKLTPNHEKFSLDEMTVGNTKWTPDSQHMLVAMWVHPRRDLRRSIYIVSRDGTDKRWLTYFGHHHSWTPDGKQVLFCGWKTYTDEGVREDPRLFLINFDGSNKRMVIDEPLGGHPIVDPSSTLVATWDQKGVILVDLEEQRVEYWATFGSGFDMSHSGTHPHCVWSPDGSQLLYNSAQTGHSQIYVLPMEQ